MKRRIDVCRGEFRALYSALYQAARELRSADQAPSVVKPVILENYFGEQAFFILAFPWCATP